MSTVALGNPTLLECCLNRSGDGYDDDDSNDGDIADYDDVDHAADDNDNGKKMTSITLLMTMTAMLIMVNSKPFMKDDYTTNSH